MSGLRKHVTMALVLLMCALTGHSSESAPSEALQSAAGGRDAQQDWRRMVEIVKHVEDNRGRHSAKTAAPLTARSPAVEPNDLRKLKTARGDQTVGVFPRDLRKKEKFLKHITGEATFVSLVLECPVKTPIDIRDSMPFRETCTSKEWIIASRRSAWAPMVGCHHEGGNQPTKPHQDKDGVLWVRAHPFYCTAHYAEKKLSLTPGISIVYPICAHTEKHL
ncbi:hypothetical protein NQZ68_005186 [Dissostichus eleginoides]|nr:hypothetical protein NQZ68_005186 [Dissostichus eleginoides]